MTEASEPWSKSTDSILSWGRQDCKPFGKFVCVLQVLVSVQGDNKEIISANKEIISFLALFESAFRNFAQSGTSSF